jgi:hypothetical protein
METYTEDQVLDLVEAEIASRPQLDLPVAACFTKGLYSRQLFMPAGIEISSECHKTQHQFIIAFGVVDIYLKGRGWERVAGYKHGITEPGTRRVFRTITDTMLITFHPIDKELKDDTIEGIQELEALVRYDIIEKRVNPYLNGGKKEELT